MASTVTSTTSSNGSRTIASLVFFATGIALVSYEVSGAQLGVTGTNAHHTSAVRIVIGGTVAGVSLTLLSHAGEAGRQFALGLATITLVSSALVYGAPFWNSLTKLTGGTPTSVPATKTAVTTAKKGTP